LIGERDWSSQEVSYLLFGIPLHSGSRQIITFDCRPEDSIGTIVDFEEGATPGKPILQKYRERRALYDGTPLLEFLRTFEHGSRKVTLHKPRPQAKPRVIVYQPQYKSQPDHPDFEDFCRTRIALQHPWRVYPTLPWNGCDSWAAAIEYCNSNCSPHEPDNLDPKKLDPPPEEFEFEEPANEDESDPHRLLAGETAFRNPAEREEDPDDLRNRQEDWRYPWDTCVNTYRNVSTDNGMPDIHAGAGQK
jgi:hypothetical protein